MKDNVKEFQIKARQKFAAQIDLIYAKQHGEFSNEAVVTAVAGLLDEHAIVEFRHIVARKIVESEDNSRRGTPIPATLDMFSEDIISTVIIALGGGLRVKLGDATMKHFLKRVEQQDEAITAAQASKEKWLGVIDAVRPLLESDASLDFRTCLCQLGHIKAVA